MIISLAEIRRVVEFRLKQKKIQTHDPALDFGNATEEEKKEFAEKNPLDPTKYKPVDGSNKWTTQTIKTLKQDIKKLNGAPVSDVTVTQSWDYNDGNLADMADALSQAILDILTNTKVSGTISVLGTKNNSIKQTQDDTLVPMPDGTFQQIPQTTVVENTEAVIGNVVGLQTLDSQVLDIHFQPSPGNNLYLLSSSGKYLLRVTDAYGIQLSIDFGAHWLPIISGGGSNSITFSNWDPTIVYPLESWVIYQGKLYKSKFVNNLNKVPGTAYLGIQWWLLFAEQSSPTTFDMPNVIFGIPDGSITDIKISPVAAIDASKIADGSVSNTEFETLNGVTSAIQTQLNNKIDGTDPRLTNARTPTAHAASHGVAGGDPVTIAQSQVSGLATSLAAKANDSAVVHNTGNETVNGIKTFGSFPVTPSSDPSTNFQVANKRYVDNKVPTSNTTAVSSTYPVVGTDHNLLANASGGPFTITLQAAATAGDGKEIKIKKVDSSANVVTIDANGSETIDGALTYPISNQWESITLVCNGAAWFVF